MVGCTPLLNTCSANFMPPKRGDGLVEERDRLAALLTARRSTFITACERLGVGVNPSHDGFFAWYDVRTLQPSLRRVPTNTCTWCP